MNAEMLSSSVQSPLKWITQKSRVIDHARQIADTSDRWFLAVTGGIVQAGGWARREAWIVADSAVAAFATTVDVAKKLSSAEGAAAPSSPRPRRDDDDERPSARDACAGGGLDLIGAVRASDVRPGVGDVPVWESGLARDAMARPNRAGVVPLLQALGRTVSKHTHAGYASLAEDPRFWTLIHLLQNLGQPSIATGSDEGAEPSVSEGPRDRAGAAP